MMVLSGFAVAVPPPDKRTIAGDHATPRDVLTRLAGDANLWVRRTAAMNPSTPRDAVGLLVRAGARPDLAGFAKPDPSLMPHELEPLLAAAEWARCVAARHPLLLPEQLQRLASDDADAVRLIIAGHPRANTQVLARLLLDAARDVRQAARTHPNVAQPMLWLLDRADRGGCLTDDECATLLNGGPWGRALVARNAFVSPAILDQLANDPLWWVRSAIADNPDAPPSALRPLLSLDAPALRVKLAAHHRCPSDVLAALADDQDVSVRGAVAAHRSADHAVLARLAEDGAVMVRAAVALNPATPTHVIERLARAGSTRDLLGFGTPDPTLEADELTILAGSNAWARQLAALHPATPTQGLALLVADANFLVRESVTRHRNRPSDLIALLMRAGSTEDLQAFDRPDPTLGVDDLRRVMSLGPWGRHLAARHPRADPAMLDELARDSDWQVRRAVALHLSSPESTLIAISADAAADVRWSLLKREELPEQAWAQLALDALPQVRLAVASDPRAPVPVKQSLRLDPDEDVRAAAAAAKGQ